MRGRPVKQKRGNPQMLLCSSCTYISCSLLYVGMGERETIAFAAEAEEEEEEGETAAEWVTRVKQKKIGGREGLYVRLVRFPPIIKNIFGQNLDECGNRTFKTFMKSCSLGQSLLLPSPLHKGPPPDTRGRVIWSVGGSVAAHYIAACETKKNRKTHIRVFFVVLQGEITLSRRSKGT